MLRVAFVASEAEAAQLALRDLHRLYGTEDPRDADVIVPLGGDGRAAWPDHPPHP